MKKIKTLIAIISDYINLKRGNSFNFYQYYNDHYSSQRLQMLMFGKFKDSSTLHRNIIAASTRQCRKEFSFIPNPDWKRYEAKFKEYQAMEGSLKSFQEAYDLARQGGETYVVKFREGGYHPGERYAEYTSGSSSCWMGKDYSYTGKLKHSNDDAKDWIYLDTVKGSYDTIGKDEWTTFRYATKEEIEKFHEDKEIFESIEKRLEANTKAYNKVQTQLLKRQKSIL